MTEFLSTWILRACQPSLLPKLTEAQCRPGSLLALKATGTADTEGLGQSPRGPPLGYALVLFVGLFCFCFGCFFGVLVFCFFLFLLMFLAWDLSLGAYLWYLITGLPSPWSPLRWKKETLQNKDSKNAKTHQKHHKKTPLVRRKHHKHIHILFFTWEFCHQPKQNPLHHRICRTNPMFHRSRHTSSLRVLRLTFSTLGLKAAQVFMLCSICFTANQMHVYI